MPSHYLIPDWPAPASIKAFTSLREGGHSEVPFDSFNLSMDVGDDERAVLHNRTQLMQELQLKHAPVWLKQIHSNIVLPAESAIHHRPEADASYTQVANLPCAVLTADCLPLLVCDSAGTQVAAIHAGWRGLAAGVIENTLAAFPQPRETLLVWLGPAIGPQAFEVGDEVRHLFMQHDAEADMAFEPITTQTWLANIYMLAKQRLARCGITHIYGAQWCTYSDPIRFYSYRRDGSNAGRMISVIWRE